MIWFKHDIDAHDDIKIKKLLKRSGFSALGVYWFLIEILFSNQGVLGYSEAVDEVTLIDGLTEEKAKECIDQLISLNLMYSDGISLSSHRVDAELQRGEESRIKKAEAGRKGGIAKASRCQADAKQTLADAKQTLANSSTQDKSRVEKSREDKNIYNPYVSNDTLSPKGETHSVSKTKKNIPTLDEVKAYCAEKKSSVNPEQFYDYYATQNWKKANGQPLSDWKRAIGTWERNEKDKGPMKPKTICNDRDVFLSQSEDGRFEL